jgi:hypothetical protein
VVTREQPHAPQPVLRAYIILHTSRYLWPWVGTRVTLGSRSGHSLQDGPEDLSTHALITIPLCNSWSDRI